MFVIDNWFFLVFLVSSVVVFVNVIFMFVDGFVGLILNLVD